MNPVHEYQPISIEMVQFSPGRLTPLKGLKVSDVAEKLFPILQQEIYALPLNQPKINRLNFLARVQKTAFSTFFPLHLFGIGFSFLFFLKKEVFYVLEGITGLTSFFCFAYYCTALAIHSIMITQLKKTAITHAHEWLDEHGEELLLGNHLIKALQTLDEEELHALNTRQIFEEYPDSWDQMIDLKHFGKLHPQQGKWIKWVYRYRNLELHQHKFRQLMISYIDTRKKFAEKVKKYPEILIAIEKDHPDQIVRSKIFALRNELGIGRPFETENPISILIDSDSSPNDEYQQDHSQAASSVGEPSPSLPSPTKKDFKITAIDVEGEQGEFSGKFLVQNSVVIKNLIRRTPSDCVIHLKVPLQAFNTALLLQRGDSMILDDFEVVWEVCNEYLLENGILRCINLMFQDIETIDLSFLEGKHYPPVYIQSNQLHHTSAETMFDWAYYQLKITKHPEELLNKITLIFKSLNIVTGPYNIIHHLLHQLSSEMLNSPFSLERYQHSLQLRSLYKGRALPNFCSRLNAQFANHLKRNFISSWEYARNSKDTKLINRIVKFTFTSDGKDTLRSIKRVNPRWFVIPDDLDLEMKRYKSQEAL